MKSMYPNDLAFRYQHIKDHMDSLIDFPVDRINRSRSLFEFREKQIIPKRFSVWTCVAGLPISEALTRKLRQVTTEVQSLLPEKTPFYGVHPKNYHWELFIVKRPTERLSSTDLALANTIVQTCVEQYPIFDIHYQGLLLTPDGVLIAKGFGDFDPLRHRLREQLTFASPQQSQLGHISLGRILSPIGSEAFNRLKTFVNNLASEPFGHFQVQRIKYVHEHQWYMEDYDVQSEYSLATSQKAVALSQKIT